jgi:hypothetical protein
VVDKVESTYLAVSTVSASAMLGQCVSLDGDTAVLGGWAATDQHASAGAAYVFERVAATWQPPVKLVRQTTISENQGFGVSVSVSGDSIAVGTKSSEVFVFVRNGAAWEQQQRITQSGVVASDLFGYGVAIHGDTLLVGAAGTQSSRGAAYVYLRNGGVWSHAQTLVPSVSTAGGRVGRYVALRGTTAVLGAFGTNNWVGAAYVYEKQSDWQLTSVLAPNGLGPDSFGSAVAIAPDETAVMIGAYTDSDEEFEGGSAYVFRKQGLNWLHEVTLYPSVNLASAHFGISVGIEQDLAVVGADQYGTGAPGALFAYRRLGSTWTPLWNLSDSAHQDASGLGISLSLSGTTVVGGAHNKLGKGAGVVFEVAPYGNGTACTESVSCQSAHCVDAVCCDTTCEGVCAACTAASGATADGTCTALAPSVTCRPSTGDCDEAETCNGSSLDCPADESAPDDTPCPGGRCVAGACEPLDAGPDGEAGAAGSAGSAGAAGFDAGDGGGSGGSAGGSGIGGAGGSPDAGDDAQGGTSGSPDAGADSREGVPDDALDTSLYGCSAGRSSSGVKPWPLLPLLWLLRRRRSDAR